MLAHIPHQLAQSSDDFDIADFLQRFDTSLNVQAVMNNLKWGLDGFIYCTLGEDFIAVGSIEGEGEQTEHHDGGTALHP